MFYTGAGHVTFQTCIIKDGNPSWGRFFVTAIPIPVMDYLHRAQPFGNNFRLDPKEIQLAFNLLNGDFNFP